MDARFVLNLLPLVAGLFPGGGTIASLIGTALKYGPAVMALIEAGQPILAAVQKAAPGMAPHLAEIGGMMFPDKPNAAEIAAKHIFTPERLTDEERSFRRASGAPGDGFAGFG